MRRAQSLDVLDGAAEAVAHDDLLARDPAQPLVVGELEAAALLHGPGYGFSQLGIIDSYRSWLGEPGTAMNMVIFADVWKNYPLVAIIVLAPVVAWIWVKPRLD